ncbi:MAG: helix-turn-helix domain-containing protein [Oscillospiraceae bacterium]|nr:helix-turn-helix domain-containing protein [Oscillospiraceae bacterium]
MQASWTTIELLDLVAYQRQNKVSRSDTNMDSHIHDQCEIYINLSGNVSFMVENRIYSIQRGDIIITRPNEAHHCIYHDASVHDHICCRFSGEKISEILDIFFNRKAGNENLISLSAEKREEMIDVCSALVDGQSGVGKYIAFFKLIELMTGADGKAAMPPLPEDIKHCIEYIHANLGKSLTVKELAEFSHVTVNTLERRFKASIGIAPYTYIQNCRLALAVSILKNGGTVSEAAEDSGFSDISHFIALFKKRYGKTPLQLKKQN